MSEIGSGSGSAYPGTLDTNANVEVDAPNAGKTKAKAAIVNDLAACILAIETELGTDPAGSKATVVARLDQEHNADGSHNDSYIVTVSGNNQTITGQKIFPKQIIAQSGIDTNIWGWTGSSVGHKVGLNTVNSSGTIFAWDIKISGTIAYPNPSNYNVCNKFVLQENGIGQGPFDILNIANGTYESIGPSASGATNIWTILDILPTNAKAVYLKATAEDITTGVLDLYCRKTGSSAAMNGATRSFYVSSATTDIDTNVDFFYALLDTSLRFDLGRSNGASLGGTCSLYLIGWLE